MAEAARIEVDGWPQGDTVVLRSRTVRRGSTAMTTARFDDSVWPLTPAHPDAHSQSVNLWWTTYPTASVRQFKTFVLAALDAPYPIAISGHKTIGRAGPGTVRLWFVRLRAFAVWLEHRRIGPARWTCCCALGLEAASRAGPVRLDYAPAWR
ncbi:hypothetical protein ACFWDI_08215 [Streptomyces sp. NPDC060064]|uniref:hypothetical protein n=1 Tax=Streptomyces sp. NPDC060064 TaxID=3347049 RepID=UPI0036B5E301